MWNFRPGVGLVLKRSSEPRVEDGVGFLTKQAYFITETASIVLTATGRTKGERSWEFKVVRSSDWLARPQPYLHSFPRAGHSGVEPPAIY